VEQLSGKTALVTGAAKRIGRAIALALSKQGVRLVLHYHTSSDLAKELAGEVGGLTAGADLASPDEAEALVERAIELAGPIDFLVNNASVFPEGRLMDFSPAALAQAININALAPFLIARRFAAQQRPGAIVNLLDARIADYDREHVPYHLSKRMLFSLTRMMALEFAPSIRVNAVAPGLILPPEGQDDAYLAALAATNPLNRCGNTDGVADAVVFLLKSDFITGEVLFVDGGRHLKGSLYGC
jgi:NAD(P)-dependent dehydrogenase (short-subunit alcohol dehydrogenase family)